jgi:hypothetical protein
MAHVKVVAGQLGEVAPSCCVDIPYKHKYNFVVLSALEEVEIPNGDDVMTYVCLNDHHHGPQLGPPLPGAR